MGIIFTVAGNGVSGYAGDGGPATAAKIVNPSSVAVGMNGDLYICDSGVSGNSLIRKVELTLTSLTHHSSHVQADSMGTISSIAGGGGTLDGVQATSAYLHSANSMTVISNGDMYITDTNDQGIRKV